MGENFKVVCAKFSTLSQVVFVMSVIARHTQARACLDLKTRPRFCPVSLSLSIRKRLLSLIEGMCQFKKTFFFVKLVGVSVPVESFQPSLINTNKPRAYQGGAHFTWFCQGLAAVVNVRLGSIVVIGANTLAYLLCW